MAKIHEENMKKINILITCDENYLQYLNVMLFSLLKNNPECEFDVYLLHSSVRDEALEPTEALLGENSRLIPIKIEDIKLDEAPTTTRYPKEIYYRIFASKYLPKELERVLYLDPDLIVNGSVVSLYELPMNDYYFAAASHTGAILQKMNTLRLDMDWDSPYINSGVMLMNLSRLREEQNFEDVFSFIEKHRSLLMLPDQDIISGLYGSKIYALDAFKYNMTELLFQLHAPFEKGLTLDWIRNNAIIIHYCGRNKPWKDNYFGFLGEFYKETKQEMEKGLVQQPK